MGFFQLGTPRMTVGHHSHEQHSIEESEVPAHLLPFCVLQSINIRLREAHIICTSAMILDVYLQLNVKESERFVSGPNISTMMHAANLMYRKRLESDDEVNYSIL